MRQNFNNLSGGSKKRLAEYKRKAAASLATVAKHHGEDSALYQTYARDRWRGERWVTPHGMGFKFSPSFARSHVYHTGVIHLDTGALDHLRPVMRSRRDDISYYSDADCSETISGRVARLPRGRFLAYCEWDSSDGITVDAEPYADEEDAWAAADFLAKKFADDEREFNEKWREARDVQDERDGERVDLKAYRHRFSAMARALRALPNDADVREAMDEARDNFHDCLNRIVARNEQLRDYAAQGVEV